MQAISLIQRTQLYVVVDYLTDTYLGMGVSVSKIDWDSVSTAADGCDVSVLFLAVRNQGLLVTA